MVYFFYLLGVGLPCRSIFYQFWFCKEAQCVYLRRHLGSPHIAFYFKCIFQFQNFHLVHFYSF